MIAIYLPQIDEDGRFSLRPTFATQAELDELRALASTSTNTEISHDGLSASDRTAADPIPTDCLHRGEPLISLGCVPCGAGVRIKVFACNIHSRCQLSDKLPDVHSCIGCKDRESQMV